MATTHTIETRFHGRFLREDRGGERFLVGLHGYAETADVHLAELHKIMGISDWSLVAIQALNRFYTRDQTIVANWMTSQDRELAIADNLDYVGRVLEWLRATYGEPPKLVFAGFSQGGAMAYRAAARYRCAGVMVLAADVPPELTAAGATLPPVLLGRGDADPWYTKAKHDADLATLARLGAAVESCVFDGAHEWAAPFYDAASRFLAGIGKPRS